MRRSLVAVAVGAAALATGAFAATASAAPAHSSKTRSGLSRTTQTVVRPVTAAGHAAHGYRVQRVHNGNFPVDCSGPGAASPVGVDRGIVSCSPSAAYAVACWHAASAHHVLCLDDARKHVVRQLTASGRIPDPAAPAKPTPLNLKLANGVYCGLRDGGAGSTLRQHHSWYASYYCTGSQAVWTAHGSGVNRDHPVWTVELANADGKQHVHKVRVARAWFVGTKH